MRGAMKMGSTVAIALASAVLLPAGHAGAQHRRDDQQMARQARRDGRIMPVPEIERRVVPTMKGAQYLGFDFDPDGAIYTLKFLRNGTVIWVDVDGRSGRVIGRTDQ